MYSLVRLKAQAVPSNHEKTRELPSAKEGYNTPYTDQHQLQTKNKLDNIRLPFSFFLFVHYSRYKKYCVFLFLQINARQITPNLHTSNRGAVGTSFKFFQVKNGGNKNLKKSSLLLTRFLRNNKKIVLEMRTIPEASQHVKMHGSSFLL